MRKTCSRCLTQFIGGEFLCDCCRDSTAKRLADEGILRRDRVIDKLSADLARVTAHSTKLWDRVEKYETTLRKVHDWLRRDRLYAVDRVLSEIEAALKEGT